MSGSQDLQAGPQCLLPRRSPGPVDRNLPDSGENALLIRPFSPRPVKYSDLARKITLRGTGSGPKKWSENDRWLLARMTGPRRGTFLTPHARGRKTIFSTTPSVYFVTQ